MHNRATKITRANGGLYSQKKSTNGTQRIQIETTRRIQNQIKLFNVLNVSFLKRISIIVITTAVMLKVKKYRVIPISIYKDIEP